MCIMSIISDLFLDVSGASWFFHGKPSHFDPFHIFSGRFCSCLQTFLMRSREMTFWCPVAQIFKTQLLMTAARGLLWPVEIVHLVSNIVY